MSNPDTRSMRFHNFNAARRVLPQLAIVWTAALFALGPSMMSAHETDQYTLPVGREFADLGPHFSAAVYESIVQAVGRTNAAIKWSLRHSNQPKETDRLQSTESDLGRGLDRNFSADSPSTNRSMVSSWASGFGPAIPG